MRRFHFEVPQGYIEPNAQTVMIYLNRFSPPQGYVTSGQGPPLEDGLEFYDYGEGDTSNIIYNDGTNTGNIAVDQS